MKYHAPTKQFVIPKEGIELATIEMLQAIRHIRGQAGLSTKGYGNRGPMEAPQFAEQAILEAAKALGIDLGATRYGKLDVSRQF